MALAVAILRPMAKFFNDFLEYNPGTFRRTSDGYLSGKVCVTGAGVFRYLDDNGRDIVRVLRPREAVSEARSLESMNGKPVTLQHPGEDVTPENFKDYAVGLSANDVEFDGLNIWVTLTVNRADAIEAMESGKVRAISCGYWADVESREGVWQGTEYSRVMSNIRINHIALVQEGRAGDGVKFRIGDSADAAKFFRQTQKAGDSAGKESTMKKNLLIDGAVFEVDEAVASRIQNLDKALADAKAEHEKAVAAITAERDALNAEIKKLKDEAPDASKIAQLVSDKVALIAKASAFGCDVKAEDSDMDIKKAVIAKVYGDGIDIKDKNSAYVDACFDIACSKSVKDRKDPLAPDMKKFGDEMDPELAYRKMCDSIGNEKKEA